MTYKITFLPASVTVEVDPARLPPNHFGKDSEAVILETAEILRHGMLRSGA